MKVIKVKHLIIITGASGTGKTTVRNYLKDKYHVQPVITHTTRPPRFHEQQGVDYYFETEPSMQQLHLLEEVNYNNHHYGSSFEGLQRAWQKSDVIEIVLDTAGAITYFQKLPHQQLILLFLTVSQSADLKERMLSRGDDQQLVNQRLESTEYQRDLHLPAALKPYAHVIVNDNWQQTKLKLDQIMQNLMEEQ